MRNRILPANLAPMKFRPLAALLLTVPAPSAGVLAAMYLWPDTAFGTAIFAVSKVWLFAMPVIWLRLVDRQPFSWSPPRHGGFGFGLLSGLVISAAIGIAYLALGPLLIDFPAMRTQLAAVGLDQPVRYLAGALYWILVNSVLEEYVWRWFVTSRCAQLLGRRAAVSAAALFFTLHHFLALSVYMSTAAAALCSLGVFIGGLTWSWMYARYQSVWPGYLSHAIVDLAIFAIGAHILFAA